MERCIDRGIALLQKLKFAPHRQTETYCEETVALIIVEKRLWEGVCVSSRFRVHAQPAQFLQLDNEQENQAI